jgi:NAD(P)-dependent dehydrogenase (short-subunit alcohol dehydrogenase family)
LGLRGEREDAVFLTQAVAPSMIANGSGVIINLGSWVARLSVAGRTGSPDDVAAATVYLASDDVSFVHGSVLDVDGGRTEVAVIAG